jgi:hypothetical protein
MTRPFLVGTLAWLGSRPYFRHPELVSGSIEPLKPKPQEAKWTLKRVQGDE